jgi:hypothetical protein
MTTPARIEAARFILDEAAKLGMNIGTDGDELVILAPLRVPYPSRRSFEIALEEYRAEVIAYIVAENAP